ncbi:MAG TPA: beta-propeller domain-containing protein [Pyrinomonadaceae bacterium]|nr:beta-propeller domain-containing protein [Pyrinomonadaceae bacterium]
MKKTISITAAVVVIAASAFIFSNARFNGSITAAITEVDPVAAELSKPKKTLRAFRSEQELKDYFRALEEKRKRDAQRRAPAKSAANAPSASPSFSADGVAAEAAKDSKEDDSVTNNQHAGVDEGGIVKVHGDHLVILRRGRLFTVKIGDNALKPVDAVDAFAPGVNPQSDWYDEMLVSGNTVVVVGYSYGRGGTEINLFDIGELGELDYRSTYHLRSNDYYSSRNYASRLIGSKLIFYTPMYLGYGGGDPMERFPAVRKWHKGATTNEFRRIIEPTNIYRAERPVESNYGMALHTVTVCDLASRDFSCTATATLGAPGRVFYVSPSSVYVWTTDWSYNYGESRKPKSSSLLYKMPLDGSAPSAVGVTGTPVDQFSFLESGDQHLNVLVRSDGYGEQMWGSEFAAGDVALFRMPVDSFSDGSLDAPGYRYQELPKPTGYTFQNRFVGDYLLYGTGSGWGRPEAKNAADLFAVNWANGDVSELRLKHGVDRIEQLGKDAVVVGTNGTDLYFSPVRLGSRPEVKESYARKNASQGELRSHGFFYKPDGQDSGLLGLPIAREGRAGYRHLVEGSAAILFLRNKGLSFDELGEMESRNTSNSDGCRASCVDWYGNARPLFVRNRVFALLGYEIVEGSVGEGRIRETRRINYSPRGATRSSEEEE